MVDDQPCTGQWLTRLLHRQPDLAVCAAVADVPAAWAVIDQHRPDLLILGLALEQAPGLDLLKDLRARGQRLPVLIFSQHPAALYAGLVRHAGAQGYLNKRADGPVIVAAVRRLLAGDVVFSAAVLASPGPAAGADGYPGLTDLERQMYALLAQGKNNQAMADYLRVARQTVYNNLTSLCKKRGATSREELMISAVLDLHHGDGGGRSAPGEPWSGPSI